MLTLPDLREKKILFISSREEFSDTIKFRDSNVCLYRDDKCVDRISIHLVLAIFIIGQISLTSVLLKKLAEHGISIYFMDDSFKVYSSISSEAEGNYMLRSVQYMFSEKKELEFSKKLVKNKIANQATVIRKIQRQKYIIDDYLLKVDQARSIDSIRGIEGNFASIYFSVIFKDVGWYKRSPRTKPDIPNLLLDIGYTFMFNYIDGMLRLFGFDTYKGIYHQLFFQRKSLACDLMEPLRPLIDRHLIKQYNLKVINEKDFKFSQGSFRIKSFDMRKKYADIWLKLIMENKEDIYIFILNFYRYMLNPVKYSFTEFSYK